ANLNRFGNGQRIKYHGNSITHDINPHTGAATSSTTTSTSQSLTTKTPTTPTTTLSPPTITTSPQHHREQQNRSGVVRKQHIVSDLDLSPNAPPRVLHRRSSTKTTENLRSAVNPHTMKL
ncbi:hypothetical protein A2U01_0033134, partial [Trifolium medium]|nr:hypothetical protein [Trifolium medium]